jgi:hypothetical protein
VGLEDDEGAGKGETDVVDLFLLAMGGMVLVLTAEEDMLSSTGSNDLDSVRFWAPEFALAFLPAFFFLAMVDELLGMG